MASTVGTAVWVALHAVQYGLAISGLNGIRSVVVCTAEQPRGGGWLSPCVQMTFGLVVAIFTLGGLVASLASRAVLSRVGIVGALRCSAAAMLIGSAGLAMGNGVGVMVCARIVIGLGCGLATTTVPLALAAIAPSSMKRSLGILNQLSIVIGIVCGQALSFPFGHSLVWRWVPGVSVAVGVLQLVMSLGVGEIGIGDGNEVAEEEPLLDSSAMDLTIPELFSTSDPKVAAALPLVLVTQVVQQLSGVSAVMYFTTSILSPISSNSKLLSLGVMCFKIPMTILPALIIERTGPKPLLILPTAFMSLCLVALAAGINTDTPALAILGITAFVAFFSVGLGPVTWVVLATSLPPHARAAASSVALGINWSFNFLVGATFLPLQQWLAAGQRSKEGDVFFVFAATCAIGAWAIRKGYQRLERID